uniref:Uncharacterized protein n=1 Tax=Clytia hemisphaerica TaxID=252671 RepID=A0A7M5V1V9_9CNID
MNNIKKAMFVPQGTNVNKITTLCLGDRFEPILYTQGFYGTGEYFLLLEIDDGMMFPISYLVQTDDFKESTRIYVINFNKEQSEYERKFLNIDIQYSQSEVQKKKTKFDPSSGRFVHVVERIVDEEIVLELYYINVGDYLTIQAKETTIKHNNVNLRLSYDARIYDGFKCEVDNNDTSLLICKAFCNPVYLDDDTYRPWFCIDFICVDQSKLSHLRRLTFKLDVNVRAIPGFPKIQVFNDKIYYYKAVLLDNDYDNEAYQIIEYNMDGKLVHRYKEIFPDDTSFKLEFVKGSALLIIHYPENRICIKKVQDGQLIILSDLRDTFKRFIDTPANNLHCSFDSLFNLQRFDQLLLGFSLYQGLLYETKDQDRVTFATLNLKNGEKVTEINDSRMLMSSFSMNWNLEEAAVTFFDRSKPYDRDGLFFKTYKVNETNPNISLKSLTRLALLTSFTPNYLLMQNLPSSLFHYLGLEKL